MRSNSYNNMQSEKKPTRLGCGLACHADAGAQSTNTGGEHSLDENAHVQKQYR